MVLAIGGYLYFSRGGTLEDLPDQLDVWRSTAEARFETAREQAENLSDWARNTADSVRDAIPTDVPLPGGGDTSGGDIAVYFSPPVDRKVEGAHEALLALIASAQKSVLCAFYDLDYMPAADALIARHKAGVRVAIVSDTDYGDEKGIQACEKAGIPVVYDERGAFMHNKFCVVDDAIVWTGSTNITENGFFRNNNNALRIASVPLARNYTDEFNEMFTDKRFGGASPSGIAYREVTVGDAQIVNYFTPDDGARDAIVKEIRGAKTSVDFAAFSFTAAEIADALVNRVRAAVAVRGVFEGRNAESEYSKDEFLLKNGVAVYNDTNPGAMHHKFFVIDKAVVITGSYNFSNAAEDKNDENVLIIRSGPIAQAYSAEFERLITEWARPR